MTYLTKGLVAFLRATRVFSLSLLSAMWKHSKKIVIWSLEESSHQKPTMQANNKIFFKAYGWEIIFVGEIMNPNLKALFKDVFLYDVSIWKKHLRYLHCQEVTGLSGSNGKNCATSLWNASPAVRGFEFFSKDTVGILVHIKNQGECPRGAKIVSNI